MYATVAEADAYVRTYYSSTDALRIAWNALSDDDKQVQLNRAEQAVDLLPYRGRPKSSSSAFPREPHAEESLMQAKLATIAVAIQLLDTESCERAALRRQGVHSYKIGDLSETFAGANAMNGVDELVYAAALPFLRTWLGGGFRICPTRTNK